MAEVIAALRQVLGKVALTVALCESKCEETKGTDDYAIHLVNYMAQAACLDVLTDIIDELEASDGSSSDPGPHIVQ